MGETCSMQEEDTFCITGLDHVEDLNVDGRMLFKCVLGK